MLEILEAAKNGNIQVLKKLKEAGVSFQEADEDGNTALLWAACSGQIETVQWLLSRGGGSSIAEKNNRGNTALSLAAIYGHLETVQWFLSIEETANADVKKLLELAALHGQLALVDYLVRHYFLSDVREIPQLTLFTRCKSIRYYIDVINIFSQQTIDNEKLVLLLEKSSERLKAPEYAYIYFICYWILVNFHTLVKAQMPQNPAQTMSKSHFMQKLLRHHKHELLSLMFKQGYILLNCDIYPINIKMLSFNHLKIIINSCI